MAERFAISTLFEPNQRSVIYAGDCRDFLRTLPDESVQLIVTSPPYNLGKEYETKSRLDRYIEEQAGIIRECFRVLKRTGSMCWQVGNFVSGGAIMPLDIALYPVFERLGMKLRNRIVWHFEHGLHCSRRFSGRYETVNWFTKSEDYYFNVDPVRIPQKYPGKKHFKGPKAGLYSCNPLGKNPGDLWIIPNVKSNHVEKTEHPCQFPVELVERLVLSLTKPDDWVFDPFLGTGTTIIAAVRHGRRGAGAELFKKYVAIASDRVTRAMDGSLRVRAMGTPVFNPADAGASLITAPWKVVSGKTAPGNRRNGKENGHEDRTGLFAPERP